MAEVVATDGDVDHLTLACLQCHPLETLQFLDWTLDVREGARNVNLCNLL